MVSIRKDNDRCIQAKNPEKIFNGENIMKNDFRSLEDFSIERIVVRDMIFVLLSIISKIRFLRIVQHVINDEKDRQKFSSFHRSKDVASPLLYPSILSKK